MRRLIQGYDRLDLTADMLLREDGAAASRRPLVSATALVYRPFLPIEDLVATLDHIASRKIDA